MHQRIQKSKAGGHQQSFEIHISSSEKDPHLRTAKYTFDLFMGTMTSFYALSNIRIL